MVLKRKYRTKVTITLIFTKVFYNKIELVIWQVHQNDTALASDIYSIVVSILYKVKEMLKN